MYLQTSEHPTSIECLCKDTFYQGGSLFKLPYIDTESHPTVVFRGHDLSR
jgi:hypothetical protein